MRDAALRALTKPMEKVSEKDFNRVCGPQAKWSRSTKAAYMVMVFGSGYRYSANHQNPPISTQGLSQRMIRIQQLLLS